MALYIKKDCAGAVLLNCYWILHFVQDDECAKRQDDECERRRDDNANYPSRPSMNAFLFPSWNFSAKSLFKATNH